jgi:CHAT domain-containing protein
MELFYENWQAGQPIPEAFRAAQLKMSEQYSPYEWAAFKLIR